jgi:uncharacterized protein
VPIRDKAWPDGYPCWVDLGSSDRLGAWDFYTDVPAHWRAYFAVGDTDGAAATTSAPQGGSVLMEPSDAPYGRMAVLTDPQGAAFVVLGPASTEQPSQGDES